MSQQQTSGNRDSTVVKVSELPTEANEELLELYFSNAKKGGGGKVKSVTINKDQHFALVEFLTPEGVEKTLQKSPHEILGKVVHVERYTPSSTEHGELNTICECRVLVTGLTRDTPDELVRLYFEHPCKSGGGHIDTLKRVDDSSALVTYTKEKDAKNVLSRESHVVDKYNFIVSRWEKPKEKTIKVSGLKPSTSEVMLELYFSNAQKSGGGDVDTVKILEDGVTALVTFSREEAVDSTLRKSPHTICGKDVFAERYLHEPLPDGNEVFEEKRTILVTCLTREIPDDLIHLYFEHPHKSGAGPIVNYKRIDDVSVLIEFVNETDAENVLSHKSHLVGKYNLSVARWKKPTKRTIRVTGLKPSSSEVLLDLYFSNRENMGGGDVESVKILEDGVSALVTFTQEEDCKEVLRRFEQPRLSGAKLSLSLFNEETEKQRVVKVSGFSQKPDREIIELLFDKVTKSDSCVQDIKFLSSTSILLTFKYADDAESVVSYAAENRLTLKGCQLKVNRVSISTDQTCIVVDGNIDTIAVDQSCIEEDADSIIVSGIPESDNLKFHFANKRKSGGGKISLMTTQEDGTVLIQFEDPSVVSRVLSHEHTVLGRVLTVRKYQPTEPVRIDPHRLFIDNISLKTKDQTLIWFVESICNYEPETVVWGTAHQSAMVLFKEEIDTKTLQKSCKGVYLDGNTLTLKSVPVSKCLRVTGFSEQTTEDHLRYFFSNPKKSNGGPVTQVTIREEGAYALVHFKDYSVAERVMNKSHTLDEQDLFLDIHYECLGLVSVIGNVAPLLKPGNIQHEISFEMAGFFKHSKVNWNALESELKTIGSDVKLTFGEQPCLILSCTLEQTEPTREKLTMWQDTAKKSVEGFLSMYAQKEVNCSKEIWDEIKNGLADDKFSLKEGGTISLKEHTHVITLTGQKQIIVEGYRHVTDMKKKVEEDFDRKRKSITEIKKEDPHKLWYLKLLKFGRKAIESHHVKVKLDFAQNTIELYGLPGDVTKCKVTLYEIFHDLKSSTLTLNSNDVKKLFQIVSTTQL